MESKTGYKMSQKIILKVGDAISYSGGQEGFIEKITKISSFKSLDEYKYDGDGKDVVLTLRNKYGTVNIWLRETPVRKITKK